MNKFHAIIIFTLLILIIFNFKRVECTHNNTFHVGRYSEITIDCKYLYHYLLFLFAISIVSFYVL